MVFMGGLVSWADSFHGQIVFMGEVRSWAWLIHGEWTHHPCPFERDAARGLSSLNAKRTTGKTSGAMSAS